MNWDQVLSAVFAITIGVLLTITILFYLEHKWMRAKQAVVVDEHPLKGRFFNRYVPPKLEARYQHVTLSTEQSMGGQRSVFWMMAVVALLIVISAIGYLKLFS